MKRTVRWLILAGVLALAAGARPAAAALITVDENGNGFIDATPLSFHIGPDPAPGGLASVLIYSLPFAGLQGDVLLTEPITGIVNDVLRFNGDGTLIFYSDNIGGADSLADTPSPPTAFYGRQVTIPEVGPEGDNGAFYTPNDAQPGFAPGFSATYHFISDGTAAVPEPGTLALTGLGMLGLVGWLRRRKKIG